jgi:heme-degrading monooxygenase HmoA
LKKVKNQNMKKVIIYTLLISVLSSCAIFRSADLKGRQGKIAEEGTIDCFPVGTLNKDQKILNCELSAAVFYNEKIVTATDKVTSPSAVFALPYTQADGFNPDDLNYMESNEFNAVRKIEDFSISPNQELVIGVTGFNRISDSKPAWNAYNSIVYWDSKKDMKAKIAHPSKVKTTVNGKNTVVMSSVKLRDKFAAAFKSDNLVVPNYYKIEGAAIIPGNKILFGIREMGESYQDFEYKILIISADYIYAKSNLELTNFRIAYEFDASAVKEVKQPIGLSSIEYDRFNDRIYLLTSYEMNQEGENTPEKVGAYLWVLSMEDFKLKKAPRLVMKKKKKPLHLAHKSEAVTVVDANTVFIANDDDRVTGTEKVTDKENQFYRKPNQGSYYIIRIK